MAIPGFCPHCGQRVRPVARSTGVCSGCSREVYANSRPAAGVLLVRQDQVLLVRRGTEPALGKWDIPGGFLEEGEPPEQGARRELREELDLEVHPDDLRLVHVSVNPRLGYAVLDLLFEASMPDQEPRPGSDAGDCGWFSIAELPEDLAFPATRRALEIWRARRRRDG